MGAGTQELEPSSAAFLGALAGSWLGSGAVLSQYVCISRVELAARARYQTEIQALWDVLYVCAV